MFRLIMQELTRLLSFDGSLAHLAEVSYRTRCISLNNQSCQPRATLININSNDPLCYLFAVNINKCGRSSNTIYDPYAPICVPNKVKKYKCKGI